MIGVFLKCLRSEFLQMEPYCQRKEYRLKDTKNSYVIRFALLSKNPFVGQIITP